MTPPELDRPTGPPDSRPTSSPSAGGWIRRLEGLLLLGILVALLCVGLLPILARQFPEIKAPVWGSQFSQHAVLWIALIGALAATRDRKHIAIDALGQLLPRRARTFLLGVTELLAAAIVGMLVPAAIRFAAAERAASADRVAFLGIPEGWLASVVPVGLALLATRLVACGAMDTVRGARGGGSP